VPLACGIVLLALLRPPGVGRRADLCERSNRLASAIRLANKKIFEAAWEKCDRYPYRDFTFHVWLLRLTDRELEANGIDPHQPTWLENVL